MNTYQEYKPVIQRQLKGHHVKLFAILLVLSLASSLASDALIFVMNAQSVVYSICSVLLSLAFAFLNYVVLFLFIKRVREERFTMEDVRYGFSKLLVLLVAGLLISILQMLISTVATLLVIVPPLYYIAMSILSVLFVLWNAMVAFAIYDGYLGMGNIIKGSFALVKDHAALLLRGGLLYVVWYVISQTAILLVVHSFLGNTVANNMLEVFEHAMRAGSNAILSIIGIYLLYYLVNFWLLVPLYTLAANVYENHRLESFEQ